MALIDLLLLAAIVAVLAILGAGGFVLMFSKRFSFMKRPYPQTGERLSKHLPIPPRPTQMVPGTAPGRGGAPAPWTPLPRRGQALKASGYRVPRPLKRAPGGRGGAESTPALEEIAEELPVVQPRPSTAYEQEMTRRAAPDIPWSYGDCKITALVRDPYWLFVYWEINEAKRDEIAQHFGHQAWNASHPVLRIYDTTNLYFFDSRHYVEIAINDYANNWYISTGQHNRTFCVELGRVRPDGSYIFLARSNFVSTPRDQISDVIDEECLLLSEYATKLYRRIGSNYPGPSSPGLPGPGEQISSPMKW